MIFTNQLRSKIGVMFGSPETTTGGNALKFYASLRLDIRRIAGLKNGEDVTGSRTKVKVVKSKIAPPFKQVEFDIMYDEGISKSGELIDLGVDHGVIKKGGAWFTFGEERFQGREQFRQQLRENPTLMANLEKDVKVKLGMLPLEQKEVVEEKSKKVMIVSEISKKGNWVNVLFDNNEIFKIPYELFVKNNLYVDDEIFEDEFSKLKHQTNIYQIKQSSFRYLGVRNHSNYELKINF